MPSSCNNAFQATPNGHNAWHWFKVKKVCIISQHTISLFINIEKLSHGQCTKMWSLSDNQ